MALDRRGFMKFAAGAGAGIMVTPLPWKLLDDISIWTQNWSWIPANEPGVNTFVSTTSKTCPSGCGIKVRLAGDRPVRVLSNPDHPLGGGVSALAAAEAQMLYSPARLRQPYRKTSDGGYQPISWDEAETILLSKLKEAGKSVACVSGDETGSSVQVLSAFLNRLGSRDFYLMPSEAQAASRALSLLGGKGQIGYDLEKSDCILAVGANILESWGTAVRNRKVFDKTHQTGQETGLKLYYAGPVQNNTAAVADKWLPIKPGSEGIFCLGLARALIMAGKNVRIGNGTNFVSLLKEFTPELVAELTGLSEQQYADMAQLLLKAKAPLVISASEFNQGGGVAPVLGAIALNVLLDGPITVLPLPEGESVIPGALGRSEAFANDLGVFLAGKPSPKVMLFYEANPVYALPNPGEAKTVFANMPFKVAFTSFLDETAELCDLVLPMPLGLERLDDIETPYGCGKPFYAFSMPVIKPLVNARPAQDFILQLAEKLKLGLPSSYTAVLKAKAAAYDVSPGGLAKGAVAESSRLPAPSFDPVFHKVLGECFSNVAQLAKASGGNIALAPMQLLKMGTPKTGIPPFNTKTLRATELAGKEMCIMLNGATANKFGLFNGSRVSLSQGDGERLFARVTVFEGVAPDTAGVYLGFGHTALDDFSRNKGGNIMQLLTASVEPASGLTVWSLARVNIAKA